MASAMLAPLNAVLTDRGSVDVNALARALDVDLPTLARVLGKSSQFLRKYPTAPSVQLRALQLVDRVNALAHACARPQAAAPDRPCVAAAGTPDVCGRTP
jgi:hypothetical protein